MNSSSSLFAADSNRSDDDGIGGVSLPYSNSTAAAAAPSAATTPLQQSASLVNQLLPYQIDYQAEPVAYLADIKHHLKQSVEQAEFTTTAFWTRQLRSYLELKYPLPKADKQLLAQLYYQLLITDGLDMSLLDTFVTMACRLLKKEYEFQPHDFEWNWRPLYRLIRRSLFPPQRRRILPGQTVDASQLIRFIHKARRYFAAGAADEILAELLPELSADSLTDSLIASTLLATFLPTVSRLPIQLSDSKPFYWVQDCFNIWTLLNPLQTWDSNFMDLFSRLACDQYGMQTVRFTDTQMRFVFEMGLRWMEFPIGTGAGFLIG
jgi:proteasome activator subunit 4